MDDSGVRRHRRYPVKWGIDLSAGNWHEVLQLTTANVSRGGLFVPSAQPVELGARLRITLKLPDNSRMEVEGVVVHALGGQHPGFGVRFDEKHAIDLNMLEATAASHAVGSNVYRLEQRHLALPAMVRGFESGIMESTQAFDLEAARAAIAGPPAPAAARPPTPPAPVLSRPPTPPAPMSSRPPTPPSPPPPAAGMPPLAPMPGAWPGGMPPLAPPHASPAGMPPLAPPRAPPGGMPPLAPSALPTAAPPAPAQGMPPIASAGAARGLGGPATSAPIPVDAGLRVSGARPAPPPPPRSRAPDHFEEDVAFDTGEQAAVSIEAPKKPATPAPASPPIFGIDFGTTYSSIALVGTKGIQILEDEDGNAMIPSVVCYTGAGSPPVVGWQARELVPVQRESTFLSPKRLLGRAYDDPKVQPFLAASPVPAHRGPNGQVLATVHGQVLAMPQVCAEIFRRLRVIGERATGTSVERVVLSAPVGYSPLERAAIERAAKLSGLEVMAVIEEPVAASMAYGLGRADGELIAIYDFGGGTFDCTVLEIKNERFNMLASGGDAWLGGDDFDLAMAEHAANEFWREHDIDLRTRAVEWQRLVLLCERAKRKLTNEERVEVRARAIVQSQRGPLDLILRFDRALFAELCGGLVERSVEEMDRCMLAAGVAPDELHHVVLTGGVSRIPLVRQHLQRYYRREIQLAVNPEQAIVMGDAIYARFLQLTGGKRMPISMPSDRA